MLKIILEGHDNYYGIGDVVRLFYGPCTEDKDAHAVYCKYGPDETIVSKADDSSPLPVNRQVKVDLYRKLSDMTGITFPWGSLTGIRPTVVAEEEGFAPPKLIDKYMVREDKAELSKRVNMKAIMYDKGRIKKVCEHIAKHYQEKIEPNGYKGQVVV